MAGKKNNGSSVSEMAAQYVNRINRWDSMPAEVKDSHPILVLITPWFQSAVPFLSAEIGWALRLGGQRVDYIWDAADVLFNVEKSSDRNSVEQIIPHLAKVSKVHHLPENGEDVSEEWISSVEEIVRENLVRKHGGEMAADRHLSSVSDLSDKVFWHLGKILALLKSQSPVFVLIPGGVYGLSAIYILACKILQIEFSTYDSGAGLLIVSHDSVGAHLEGVTQAFKEIEGRINEVEYANLEQFACERIALRRVGGDVFHLQPSGRMDNIGDLFDIIVPLNYRSDTAALQRSKLFVDVRSWLSALLHWVTLQENVRILIRQHPCEKLPQFRGSDEWEQFLLPFKAGLNERLRFVSSEDNVNTYDLLESAKVVLPYTSRIGIEAAFLGIPVVGCARCYYQNLGFTWQPENVSDYFEHILKAVNGELLVSKEAKRRAALTYFLAEECSFVATNFTPFPIDFDQWIKVSSPMLFAQGFNSMFIQALKSRKSLAKLMFDLKSKKLFAV